MLLSATGSPAREYRHRCTDITTNATPRLEDRVAVASVAEVLQTKESLLSVSLSKTSKLTLELGWVGGTNTHGFGAGTALPEISANSTLQSVEHGPCSEDEGQTFSNDIICSVSHKNMTLDFY